MADLCQLGDLKGWLEIPPTNTSSDALLGRLIAAVSAEFIQEIDRDDFTPAAAYTDVVRLATPAGQRVPEKSKVVLKHWPVNSVASVYVDGTEIEESSDGIEDGYVFDDKMDAEARTFITIIGSGVTVKSDVKVTYNAGYSTVPKDVEQAVIDWAAFRYRGRQWIGQVRRQLDGTRGEIAEYEQTDMPLTTKKCVERYKRPAGKLAG